MILSGILTGISFQAASAHFLFQHYTNLNGMNQVLLTEKMGNIAAAQKHSQQFQTEYDMTTQSIQLKNCRRNANNFSGRECESACKRWPRR